MDAKTVENLLFFLDRTKATKGVSRNQELIGRIATQIEKKEWLVTGEFKDLFMLINILNNNKTNFKSEKLWEQIEAVVCHQCFSEQSTKEVP